MRARSYALGRAFVAPRCSASPAGADVGASTRPPRPSAIRFRRAPTSCARPRSIGRNIAPATEPMSPVMRDPWSRPPPRHLRPLTRRPPACREGDRRQHQRRVRRRDRRRAPPLPRAARRVPRFVPHDTADQPPARGRRLRRQPLRAGPLRRSRDDHRSPRTRAGDTRDSYASGAPNPRCSSPASSRGY